MAYNALLRQHYKSVSVKVKTKRHTMSFCLLKLIRGNGIRLGDKAQIENMWSCSYRTMNKMGFTALWYHTVKSDPKIPSKIRLSESL